MKFVSFVALLIVCQNSVNAFVLDDSTSAPITGHNYDIKFSAQLLVTPVDSSAAEVVKGTENPVIVARRLLLDLQLFNLVGEVVQAKHVDDDFGHGLLFEMSNPLQASEVVHAWVDPTGELCKQLQVAQVVRDFYEPQIDFRSRLL